MKNDLLDIRLNEANPDDWSSEQNIPPPPPPPRQLGRWERLALPLAFAATAVLGLRAVINLSHGPNCHCAVTDADSTAWDKLSEEDKEIVRWGVKEFRKEDKENELASVTDEQLMWFIAGDKPALDYIKDQYRIAMAAKAQPSNQR